MKDGFKIGWKTCFKIGLSIFILYLCIHFFPPAFELFKSLLAAAFPLVLGCAIAYIVNLLMDFYERHFFPKTEKKFLIKTRRPLCLFSAYITLVAIVTLVIMLIVPQLIDCITMLVAEIPDSANRIVTKLFEKGYITDELVAQVKNFDWKGKLEQFAGVLTSGLGSAFDVVVSTVTSVISGVITAFVAIVFSFYLLLSKDKLRSQGNRLMKHCFNERVNQRLHHIIKTFDKCFHKYIVGQCTEAAILGGLCTLGMWILRLPYATMIGAFVAFTALIPVAGAYIGGAVGAFMIFTESPVKALIFIVFLIILQQIEGNLIYPKVVGSSMGLPGIWVLAAITVGGGIMGITGMLLSVPVAAALYRFIGESVRRDEKARVNE